MTVIIDNGNNVDAAATVAAKPYPISGVARWLSAAALAAGGLFQALEFLLEPPLDSTRARVDWWVANSERVQLSQAFGMLAIPFLIAGFLVVLRLARESSRRTAFTSAAMLVVAMVGLAGVHGAELAARIAAEQGNVDAAVGILDFAQPGISGITLLVMFLPMAAIGTILLAISMWRSPYVPRVCAVIVIGFNVLDFALGFGVASHSLALVGDVILGWAVVTGYMRASRARSATTAD